MLAHLWAGMLLTTNQQKSVGKHKCVGYNLLTNFVIPVPCEGALLPLSFGGESQDWVFWGRGQGITVFWGQFLFSKPYLMCGRHFGTSGLSWAQPQQSSLCEWQVCGAVQGRRWRKTTSQKEQKAPQAGCFPWKYLPHNNLFPYKIECLGALGEPGWGDWRRVRCELKGAEGIGCLDQAGAASQLCWDLPGGSHWTRAGYLQGGIVISSGHVPGQFRGS